MEASNAADSFIRNHAGVSDHVPGIVTAGASLFVLGPGTLIPAFIAGSATGNALIRHRQMTPEERAFAEGIFGNSLPPNDRIVLTNLSGLEGAKFTCPNLNGEILINLGNAYDNPLRYSDNKYPTPGKVFIHELAHAWQIHHASFVPGLVCTGIINQLADAEYRPGPGGKNWSEYNLEQQGTIVDEWYAPSFRRTDRTRALACMPTRASLLSLCPGRYRRGMTNPSGEQRGSSILPPRPASRGGSGPAPWGGMAPFEEGKRSPATAPPPLTPPSFPVGWRPRRRPFPHQ